MTSTEPAAAPASTDVPMSEPDGGASTSVATKGAGKRAPESESNDEAAGYKHYKYPKTFFDFGDMAHGMVPAPGHIVIKDFVSGPQEQTIAWEIANHQKNAMGNWEKVWKTDKETSSALEELYQRCIRSNTPSPWPCLKLPWYEQYEGEQRKMKWLYVYNVEEKSQLNLQTQVMRQMRRCETSFLHKYTLRQPEPAGCGDSRIEV